MCLNCFTWWSQFNWWLAITLNLWLNTPVSSPTVPVVLKRNKVRWARFVSVRMYFFCHWCSQGAVFNLFMPIGGAYRPYRAPEGCFLYKRLSELMTVCFPAANKLMFASLNSLSFFTRSKFSAQSVDTAVPLFFFFTQFFCSISLPLQHPASPTAPVLQCQLGCGPAGWAHHNSTLCTCCMHFVFSVFRPYFQYHMWDVMAVLTGFLSWSSLCL